MIQAIFRCPNGHEQRLTWHDTPREWVENQIGLLDGTSPMYKFPPDDKSEIGKCGICGARIKGEIVEADWRIGLSVRPKDHSHARYYGGPGEVVAIEPTGTNGIFCANGVLRIRQSGAVFLAPVDEWEIA